MDKPVDLIMWAGEEHYTVSSFIDEAKRMGVSKRIPQNSIPHGIVPGQSRIFIKHRKAMVYGELEGLSIELSHNFHIITDLGIDDNMLELVMILEQIHEQNPEYWNELVEEYDLTWAPGVIGYSYITGLQYVAQDNEEGLPEELAHMEHLVEPVRIEYEDR